MGKPHSVEEPQDLAHEVSELTREASALKDQVRLLRMTLDEFHTDFIWAVQNMERDGRVNPPFRMTSLPLDPAGDNHCGRVNEHPAPDSQQESRRTEMASAGATESDQLPELTIARVDAVEQFRKYLDEAGHKYRAPLKEEVERLDMTVALLPDFVIARPAEALLITVRRCLSEGERADMAKWQQAFGPQFQAAQVWGWQGKYGISWRTEVIVEGKKSPEREAMETTDEKLEVGAEREPVVDRSRPGDAVRHASPRKAAQTSQPLYMRIMQLHMTDIVRAIGYEELPQKDAYDRLVPLMEKYGKEKIEAAARELIEAIPDRREFYRLSAAARPFAVQLLGRPAKRKPAETSDAQVLPAAAGAIGSKESGVEIKLPRDKVINKFKAWVESTNRSFTPLTPETIQGLKACSVLLPDGIVDGTELVTVRQMLSNRQRGDMKAWLTLMGKKYEAVRTWPTSRGEGTWNWMWEVVASAEDD